MHNKGEHNPTANHSPFLLLVLLTIQSFCNLELQHKILLEEILPAYLFAFMTN